MTDKNDPLVQITQHTGNYIINKPDKTTTEVRVVIEKYGFDYEFSFDKDFYDVTGEPWDYAIDDIVNTGARTISDRNPQVELREILHEHRAEIHEAWEENRKNEIEDRIESLKKEKESL